MNFVEQDQKQAESRCTAGASPGFRATHADRPAPIASIVEGAFTALLLVGALAMLLGTVAATLEPTL